MKKSTIIIIAVVVILVGYFAMTYNRLVTARTAADAQWAQVETQYQRRFDLIPNLVNAVKGVMKQETAVFGAIADARTRYAGATTPDAKAAAASEVESSFARLLVVMENYPQLQSSANVQTLQAQIEGTENRISTERGRYNEDVRSYNLVVSRFPSSLVASVTGFDSRSYFEAAAGTEVAPTVEF
ncbi:MAG TPA: LemA family protein [Candidatus Paceibacterota bacterium]